MTNLDILVERNASCTLLNPYVLLTPIGSQIRHSMKSKNMIIMALQNRIGYHRAVNR